MRRSILALLLLLAAPLAAVAEDYKIIYYIELHQSAFQQLRVRETIEVYPSEDVEPVALRFRLPADATEVACGDQLKQEGREVVTRNPVSEPARFTWVYLIRGDGKRIRLVRKLMHAASSVRGFCPEGSYKVRTKGIEPNRGVLMRDGKPWIEFHGEDLEKDHEISITLTSVDVGNPIAVLYPIIGALMVLGFACLIGGLSLSQRALQRADVKTRAYLTAQLVALEEAKVVGAVQDDYYNTRKQELQELLEP